MEIPLRRERQQGVRGVRTTYCTVLRTGVLAICAIGVLAGAAQAQTTVINPTAVEFTASADHNTSVGGVAVVGNYQLDTVSLTPTGALAFTKALGKPTPSPQNLIRVTVPEFLTLTANQVHYAYVSAVGPSGSGRSAVSDPFARLGAPTAPGKPVPVP